MPSVKDLSPDIPSNIVINPNDPELEIQFTLGYDTVSCNCGNGDCFTQCGSDTGTIATFVDNLNSKTVTLPYGIFKWEEDKLILFADDSITQYQFSLKVTLQLEDYPNTEGRSYDVNVTIAPEKLTKFAFGYTNSSTTINLSE